MFAASSMHRYYIRCTSNFSRLSYATGGIWRYSVNVKRSFNDIGKEGCDSSSRDGDGKTMYFHISPSGDWWTGPSIFAAKHLQPDYVKSIPMPPGFNPSLYFGEECDEVEGDEQNKGGYTKRNGNESETIHNETVDSPIEQTKVSLSWEAKQQLLYQIYDEGEIPEELLNDRSLDGSDD